MKPSDIEYYHALALSEKENYLKFVYELGEGGLKKLFKFPGEDFSFWWSSLIAEKSTLKSDVYSRLIAFLAEKRGDKVEENFKNNVKDTMWFNLLSGPREFFRFFARIIYIKILMRRFNKRKRELSAKHYIIASYFPAVSNEAAKSGIFENQYLDQFHSSLEEKGGDYSHILFAVNIHNNGLSDSLSLARKFYKKQSLFFIEEFFKIKHLFLWLFYYAYFISKFLLNFPVVRKSVKYEYEGRHYDIWHILKGDFYRSFCGPNLANSIWYAMLFKEIVAALNDKSKIVCIYENQWWEKALYIYAKKRNLTSIGYQHTIVPDLSLHYFSYCREIGNDDFIKNCPLPDYIATVGSTTAKLFIECGWPKERVFIWGAQRFRNLKDIINSPLSWDDKKDYIIAAFSIESIEIERMLSLLLRAFQTDTRYKVILKGHPSVDLQKVTEKLGMAFDTRIFEISREPLFDIIRRAKGIIATATSSSLFGLAYGIPVIVPRFADRIDCNPLSYITEAPIYVYSHEQLVSVCNNIMSSKSSPVDQDSFRKIFYDYFYFPEGKDAYFEKIRQISNCERR